MEQLRRQTDDEGGSGGGENDPRSAFGSGLDGFPEDSDERSRRVAPLTESTYHCDNIPLVIPDHVQVYQLPARGTADALLASYLESVHPAFPIIGRKTFVNQYRTFYDNPNLKTGPAWLAILNLIFAISADTIGLSTRSCQVLRMTIIHISPAPGCFR